MRRFLATLLCITLILGTLSGCGSQKDTSGTGNISGTAASKKDNSEAKKTENPGSQNKASGSTLGSSKVFKPDELLSAEEASQIVGTVVTIEEGTLKIDSETGISDTYYVFDVGGGTTLSALFRLKQNGAIKKDKLTPENTAESAYKSELEFGGSNTEPIEGLGDKAYLHTLQNQVNVLYGDYYFLVGFGADDQKKAREDSLKVAKKIIENINKKK
jgi:hypothetical protein